MRRYPLLQSPLPYPSPRPGIDSSPITDCGDKVLIIVYYYMYINLGVALASETLKIIWLTTSYIYLDEQGSITEVVLLGTKSVLDEEIILYYLCNTPCASAIASG